MGRLLLLGIAVVTAANIVNGLSCRPCDPLECGMPQGCKFGLTKDVCACCDVCAKGTGEACGGMWFLEGKCGEDFICDSSNSVDEYYSGYPEEFKIGVCVKIPKLPNTEISPLNILGGTRGGSHSSGLLGSSTRSGQAKKIAKKHKHNVYGSGIPPEFLQLLQKGRSKRSTVVSGFQKEPRSPAKLSHEVRGGIPRDMDAVLYVHPRSNHRSKRAISLPGTLRRAGASKLTATQHTHNAYGGIPEDIKELLKAYRKNSGRSKRAVNLPGAQRRAGASKLTATQHTHNAYGGIPKDIKDLLKAYRKNSGRSKRAVNLPGAQRRAGASKLTATQHTHNAYGGIPEEIKDLLKAYRKNNGRSERAVNLPSAQRREGLPN